MGGRPCVGGRKCRVGPVSGGGVGVGPVSGGGVGV